MNLTTWVVVHSIFSALFSNYKTLSALLNIKMYINIVICTWVCCFHLILECLSLNWKRNHFLYLFKGVSKYFDIHISSRPPFKGVPRGHVHPCFSALPGEFIHKKRNCTCFLFSLKFTASCCYLGWMGAPAYHIQL